MIRFQRVVKLRVVYKGGHACEFEVTKFQISPRGDWEWENAFPWKNKPVKIGVDEIAAIWQVSTRWRLRFGKKPSG